MKRATGLESTIVDIGSTTSLSLKLPHQLGASDEDRTRDLLIGNQTHYRYATDANYASHFCRFPYFYHRNVPLNYGS